MKRNWLASFWVLLALAATAHLAFGLTLSGYPKFQAIDSNGSPLSGGKLYTYYPGSGTTKTAYSDSNGATAHTNPITLDSRGEATIFFNGSYKLMLTDSAGTLIWTFDNFSGTGVNYDTTSSVSGNIAVSSSSGTSEVRFVESISGASIIAASIPSSKLVDPIETGVSGIQKEITGSVYYCDLTQSETISGNTLYGGFVGNWLSTSEVTATLPAAKKGMSILFMLTQGQASGKTVFVRFNAVDSVVGLATNFTTSASAVQVSGTTLTSYLALNSWRDNYWWVTGNSGIAYRNL